MATEVVSNGAADFELPPRKKPKIGELPLSSTQRASIDGILHTFKKKGEFDGLRKRAFQQYNESAQRGMFEAALRTFTNNEIERDPIKYLKPDRRMGAPLLEGAAARSDIYKQTEVDIEGYIDQYLANAEVAMREIRRKEVGDTAADEEIARGNKSDEAYAAEADARRKEREKKHKEGEKISKKQESQERKKKELEALKKKQEELMKETERLQREQKRRAEREAWKAAEKERERERIKKFNEDREKQKKEAEEREKAAKEEKERRQREKAEREQKRLDEEALEKLLQEGKQMAEKAKRPELERSESMEPPPRLTRHTSAPKNSMSRDEMRAQGLMPTSMTLRKGDRPSGTPGDTRVPATPISGIEEERRASRTSRARSPSPNRSLHARARRETPLRDDGRRPSRRDAPVRRDRIYRDISAEREAWKAKQRGERGSSRDRGGEEGEVVESTRGSVRARSRSRDSHRDRRRRESRSPPRRRFQDGSRSRSPPRRRYRDDSRRRDRSRSPPGIDRYVPGGAAARRGRDNDDRDDRRRRDDDDRDRRTKRESTRYDDRPKPMDIDRYMPGGGNRAGDSEKSRRRERSRSRVRERSRDRGDRDRERVRERSRSPQRRGRDDRDREREKDLGGERPRDRGEVDREGRGSKGEE